MRGFADNVGRERVRKMVDVNFYRINEDEKTRRRKAKARIQREGNGMEFCISEEGRRLFLASNNIEGKELKERDKKELLKLGDWLESQALRNKEAASSFDIGRLYMYIMLKAKTDTDFLNWWSSYNFKISKYVYNYQNGYRNIKKLVG